MKLSDTQAAILAAAAQHPEHLAYPPERLPAGARQKVAQALLKQDLVIGVHRPAYDAVAKWTVDGEEMLLKITDDGLRAIGIDPNAGDVPEEDEQGAAAIQRRAAAETTTTEAHTPPQGGEAPAPQHDGTAAPEATQDAPEAPAEAAPAPRASHALRTAATALLAAWDAPGHAGMEHAIATLRAALAGRPARAPRDPAAPRKPREGTKQEAVLALLRRVEGATIAQIMDATGWQQHTVRGFFAGLKKRQGIAVEVMERVRQVGPDKQGAKGSYSVYRVADAG